MTSTAEIRAAWLEQLLSTEPADRLRAEEAVSRLFIAAGFPKPRHFLWFDSPFDASWPVALLVAPHHSLWRDKLASSARSKDDKARIERAEAALVERLRVAHVKEALAAMGAPRGGSLQWPPDVGRMFSTAFLEARHGIVANVMELFKVHGDDDDLARAETHFWGGNKGALRSALHCPTTDSLIGHSFFEEYSFSSMADDEERVGNRQPPALLSAASDVARSSGMWWAFEHGAILTERPVEIYVNDRKLLERGDGPAVVFRDGQRAYAWNGKAVPERWITEPGSIAARDLKGFDPTFKKFVESKLASSGAKAKKRSKPDPILKALLPSDPATRLEQLRSHAGGRLPLFDRYRAGEYQKIWAELVALGQRVREEPNAADALAVAYETMQRVSANVTTLVDRLTTMRYVFNSDGARPHTPPSAVVRKALADFEKEAGAIPLSLRAFYEVVGEVNLNGAHPFVAPANSAVAPDPLLVYGFDDRLAEYDDEDEGPSAIVIAPDDLHKADVSGGDAYEIGIPNPNADAKLLNERHDLLFVDYLRLCFKFGGFPGYEGRAAVPKELATLSAGLVEF